MWGNIFMKIQKLTLNEVKATVIGGLAIWASIPSSAFAAGMPWENPLKQILASLQGTTAQTIIIMAIVIAGLAFCVGEAGSFFRRCSAAVFGGAIAIGASSWAPTLFGW